MSDIAHHSQPSASIMNPCAKVRRYGLDIAQKI